MLIMVTGGREYDDEEVVSLALGALAGNPDIEYVVVIQGGARGADTLARRWCERHGIPCETFRADWNRYGRSAGIRRNREMLDYGPPDLVVAFPGGVGTADAVREARARGIPVRMVTDGKG